MGIRSVELSRFLNGLWAALATWLLISPSGAGTILVSSRSTVIESRRTGGNSQECQFRIINRSRNRLILSQLDLGCNCGERTLLTEIIPPGGSYELNAQWTRLSPPSGTGVLRESSIYTTSDPELPRFIVQWGTQGWELSCPRESNREGQNSLHED